MGLLDWLFRREPARREPTIVPPPASPRERAKREDSDPGSNAQEPSKRPRPVKVQAVSENSPIVLVEDGKSAYVMDRDAYDYAYGDARGPDPAQRDLDATLPKVTRVCVLDGAMLQGHAMGGRVLVDICDSKAIADLAGCLQIVENPATFAHCQCLGGPTIELYAGPEHVATIGLQHGGAIRWNRWYHDAQLKAGDRLTAWLHAGDRTGQLESIYRRGNNFLFAPPGAFSEPEKRRGGSVAGRETGRGRKTGRSPESVHAGVRARPRPIGRVWVARADSLPPGPDGRGRRRLLRSHRSRSPPCRSLFHSCHCGSTPPGTLRKPSRVVRWRCTSIQKTRQHTTAAASSEVGLVGWMKLCKTFLRRFGSLRSGSFPTCTGHSSNMAAVVSTPPWLITTELSSWCRRARPRHRAATRSGHSFTAVAATLSTTCFTRTRQRPTFLKARDCEPATALGYLGEMWLRRSKHGNALEVFAQLIALRPDEARGYLGRGMAYEVLGELEQAANDYSAAIDAEPAGGFGYSLRARVRHRQGQPDLALSDLSDHLRLYPSDHMARLFRPACTENARSGPRRSKISIRHTAAPEDATVCNNLAWTLATCPDAQFRDSARAVALARHTCEATEWKYSFCLGTLAAALAETGDFDGAARWQTEALDLYPEDEKPAGRSRLALYEAREPYRE